MMKIKDNRIHNNGRSLSMVGSSVPLSGCATKFQLLMQRVLVENFHHILLLHRKSTSLYVDVKFVKKNEIWAKDSYNQFKLRNHLKLTDVTNLIDRKKFKLINTRIIAKW